MASWFWKSASAVDSQPESPHPPSVATQSPPGTTTACPVDHRTRESWLQKSESSSQRSHTSQRHPAAQASPRLGEDREISTIPRAFDTDVLPTTSTTPLSTSPSQDASASACPAHGSPANSEQDTGHDRESGNWVYPSEKMFFDAMARKNFDPQAADMRSIVPIHNAVNERAWTMIKRWEQPYEAESRWCGGPKLLSFKGLGAPGGNDGTWSGWVQMMSDGSVSPRAKWKTLNGYKAPFDRHDWVVDRCGKRIEYIIDFYEGKGGGLLNFYLDVRPKLNSWEGWKMRAWKSFGDR